MKVPSCAFCTPVQQCFIRQQVIEQLMRREEVTSAVGSSVQRFKDAIA